MFLNSLNLYKLKILAAFMEANEDYGRKEGYRHM
jgi:hypothetical protein